MELIGWQIVGAYTDNPPTGMATFEVYTLDDVLRWLVQQPNRANWRLLPVYEGDVEEPNYSFL